MEKATARALKGIQGLTGGGAMIELDDDFAWEQAKTWNMLTSQQKADVIDCYDDMFNRWELEHGKYFIHRGQFALIDCHPAIQ